MSRVIVRVEELVLRGFAAAQRHAIAEGLRAELATRLADPAARAQLLAQAGATVLRAPDMTLDRTLAPPAIGARIAHSALAGQPATSVQTTRRPR